MDLQKNCLFFFFSSRRRHTRYIDDWSSDVCSSDLTTTAMAATLAAFYRRVPVGHVEAGLRSGRLDAPFPEEMNRVVVDRLATHWFAPTPRALENLRHEGADASRVTVTGNTAIDALLHVRARIGSMEVAVKKEVGDPKRLVLVTA